MRNLIFLCLALAWPAAGAELDFNFGELAGGGAVTNFHAELLGGGGPPDWKIIPGEAPSAFAPLDPTKNTGGGSVLAQTSQDPADERFPMYIYDGDKFRNFQFTTQLKLVSGTAEQMAGVVFRYQNASNFYVARISGLGQNIRFYKVYNGMRSDPLGPGCKLAPGTWHELGVHCDGNQIDILLDGRKVMPTLGDNTFSEGKIGFWTKSDSVSYFANARMEYTPIVPAAQALVDRIMRQQSRILGLRIYTLGTNDTRVLASKDLAERGMAGTDAELAAIRDGTVSFGRDSGAVLITMPLRDRNGDYIAAVRVKLKSFLGETQNNALMRATMILNAMQEVGLSAGDLEK